MTQATKIGRYEIVEERGHGAMGAVFLARDPAMDRIVALKTIHSVALSGPQSNEYRERFYGEARAAGRLAHPGIVPVFDVGEQDGLPYLVMEYIEGQTLADSAKSGRRLALERVCELGQQIAEALGYAHKHGVVHRDIKPANILLTSAAKYGIERPKITDFGVAKLAASQLTTTGQLLGTPAFMPPEQFTGSVIDGRSDLFSLGVILYWLATGDQPFPGETVTAVSYKVVHTEAVPPRRLNPAISVELEQCIMKCLAKDPLARYQTGEELAQNLAAIRAGRTTPNTSPTFTATSYITGDARVPDASADHAMNGATLDSDLGISRVRLPATQKTAVTPPPVVSAEAVRKGPNWLLIGVASAIVLLAGSWYFVRTKLWSEAAQTASGGIPEPSAITKSEPPSTGAPANPSSPPSAIPPTSGTTSAPSGPDPNKSATPKKGKAEAKSQPSGAPISTTPAPETAAAASVPVTPASAPPPAPSRVDFDPTALKPNDSARLRVEADHFPASLGFTLEMDGKIYFERGAKSQTTFDNLYAPPGIHEFRVTAGLGASRKVSNIVSTDFRAKKKKTLRLDLRRKSSGATPESITPDTQLVLTLK
jgi:eukaryotic-like serine/threonine-protein kinase